MADPFILDLKTLYAYFLVLSRLGGFIHFMPGLSENYVPSRIRLLIALTLTVVLTPLVESSLPSFPSNSFVFLGNMLMEAIIGMTAGVLIKTFFSTLELVGTLIGFQIGLSNAFTTSLATSQQTGLPAAFLTTIGMILIFSLNLHHDFLTAFVDSYQLFIPQKSEAYLQLSQDFLQSFFSVLGLSFRLALQLSAPMIIFSLVIMLALGLLGRLVPQLQIYFVLQPFQIFLGVALLMVTFKLMFRHFWAAYAQTFGSINGL